MKKNFLAIVLLSIITTGCSSTNESGYVDEGVSTTPSESVNLDENGFITDDVAIVSISEDDYNNEMDNILTEDGYTMRIDTAKADDKSEVLKDNIIYFGFDSSKVTPKMENTLRTQLEFLKKYPKIKVILEGHTDERGSNAYNVVLGEKRAKSVKKMLVDAGIPDKQIEIISYGEMKPANTGTGEANWKQNRRAIFVYK